MKILANDGKTTLVDKDNARVRQYERYNKSWVYNWATICGCCGSRYCGSGDPDSVYFFNHNNHGIQLLVNPTELEIVPPNKIDKFELISVTIENVNLLFKLSTVNQK